MRIIDISWTIRNTMTEYKDARTVDIGQTRTVEQDGVSSWMIQMANHTGTHIDGPAHFIADGKTLDQLPITHLVGPCQVLDLTHVKQTIMVDDLQPYTLQEGAIVLLKTSNSFLSETAEFNAEFITLSQQAATFLVEHKVKAVGIDYLGIEINQKGHPTHKTLLSEEIPIIEGLRLQHVEPGEYVLCCLPLKIEGVDSAPARAVLIDPDSN